MGKPQVAYRETITQTVEKSTYTHKKQTGGSGQYAEVQITLEPTGPGGGYEFVDKISGGRIPKEYIPSVDAGIQASLDAGVLAGYPTVDIRATLTDGKYHDVDSSEMAFKIAGTMAFKEAARKAKPVILEPIMKVEVVTPEDYMGDVIGDLNSRRGQVGGMSQRGAAQVIDATVPLSEMFGYVGDLRSKTQGRAQLHDAVRLVPAVPGQRPGRDHQAHPRRIVATARHAHSQSQPNLKQHRKKEAPPWPRRSSIGRSPM